VRNNGGVRSIAIQNFGECAVDRDGFGRGAIPDDFALAR
jgi:hypothetical protein